MVSRRTRKLFYAAFALPMRINGHLYRLLRQPKELLNVHLGCGQRNYIEGWVNVDANFVSGHIDLWANLLDGLPFRASSVEKFYSFHVIEHLPDSFLARHLRDLYNALVPGGSIRIGGPDIGRAWLKFVQGEARWFSDFPDKHMSIGGKFTNLVFCRNEHLTALSESYLTELTTEAGFVDLHFCKPCQQTVHGFAEVLPFEREDDFECPHSVILEARKRARP